MKLEALRERFQAGDRRIVPRMLTRIENDPEFRERLLQEILSETGKAHRIGITGPPGAGKSTLTNLLALRFAEEGHRVGVLAVDPTSPFSGGALLGDRIRMTDAGMHPRVYIRSMATRGSLGGLSRATVIAADFLDAMGFDVILTETVGVGQIELDVLEASDTVVVVLVPESGDGIQAMKAGLMEIADIIVVNKADREGARRLVREIETALRMGTGLVAAKAGHDRADLPPELQKAGPWEVPVLTTVAIRKEGIEELREAIRRHREYLESTGIREQRRKDRIWATFRRVIQEHLWEEFLARTGEEKTLREALFRSLETHNLRQFLEETVWKVP